MAKVRVRHQLSIPVTGRVNNTTYIIQPGEEGTIVEDQKISAREIVNSILADFNNAATANKAQFIVTDVEEESEVIEVEEKEFNTDNEPSGLSGLQPINTMGDKTAEGAHGLDPQGLGGDTMEGARKLLDPTSVDATNREPVNRDEE